jgi:uncharacterized protein (TIGR03086 family)
VKLGPIGVRAKQQPDELALVDDDRALTWRELAREVEAVGAHFAGLAADPDQRVGVLGENRVETVVAHIAGILAGIGTVALSRQLTGPELVDQLTDAQAVALVSGPGSLAAAALAAEQTGIALITHNVPDAMWPGIASTAATVGDDFAAQREPHPPIVYTSGTTGRARGTAVRWLPRVFTTAADYAEALAAKESFPAGPHLVVGPLQHNGPLTSLRHIVAGQPLVVLGKYGAERILQLIEAHGVTSSVMVPTHFQRLLALPGVTRSAYDLSSLGTVAHTGSACPADVKRAMIEWWGPVLTESYGGSEIGTVCRITSQEWLAHPLSVGRCVPPFEAVVLDEEGNELPAGQVGVLGFRTPPEYDVEFHRDPEKTAKAHIAPGVASLGDVGYVDEDGFVFVTDRISDMVISGGVNLYPAEIERVLQQHPAVAEAAVIGVPHPDLGESLLALVVCEGEQPAEQNLVDFMKQSLAAYKVPRVFRFVPELERNAMDKIDKKVLREQHTGPTSMTQLLLQGMDLFDAELAKVTSDDWQRPTPCAEWNVSELVRHTADTADRVSAFLRGETWEASTSIAQPAERWKEASTDLRAGLDRTPLDARWPIPEDAPHAKFRFHGCDFAVHTWDLSVALGHEAELPAGFVTYMDRFFHAVPPEVLRRPRAFHDPEEPGEDDGPARRLMAFLGRRP